MKLIQAITLSMFMFMFMVSLSLAQDLKVLSETNCVIAGDNFRIRAKSKDMEIHFSISQFQESGHGAERKKIHESSSLNMIMAKHDISKVLDLIKTNVPGSIAIDLIIGEYQLDDKLGIAINEFRDVEIAVIGKPQVLKYSIEGKNVEMLEKVFEWCLK